MAQTAYERPHIYALEHAHPEPDEAFFEELARTWRVRRAADIGCGHGRLTSALARGMHDGGHITAVDPTRELLALARDEVGSSVNEVAIDWIDADATGWVAPAPLDLIIAGCGTFTHLLSLDDQIAAFLHAFENLAPGGRLVVDVPAPDFPGLARSFSIPPQLTLFSDGDFSDGKNERLLRQRSERYHGVDQSQEIHYFYDYFVFGKPPERLVSSYNGHVFFPREFEMLFRHTGFELEALWGDYQKNDLAHGSRVLIGVGRRP